MTDSSKAIQASLKGDWEKAIELNLGILESTPNDIDTLNRLAFAYTATGNPKKAKATYQKVLTIDEFNPIALKNIEKLTESIVKKNAGVPFSIDNKMFLEEVGKTKIITLVNTAPPRVLRTLRIGQEVQAVIKRSKIFVLDQNKQFIGMLPDNISRRLIKFMKGGNQYTAHIKTAEEHEIAIFMKETKRTSRFKNQPSFVVSDMPKQAFSFNKKKSHDLDEEEDTAEE